MSPTDNTSTVGATLPEPQRTTAVWSVRVEIDEWMSGSVGDHDVTIRETRSRLIGMTQRVDALQALGPPCHEALHELVAELGVDHGKPRWRPPAPEVRSAEATREPQSR